MRRDIVMRSSQQSWMLGGWTERVTSYRSELQVVCERVLLH